MVPFLYLLNSNLLLTRYQFKESVIHAAIADYCHNEKVGGELYSFYKLHAFAAAYNT